MRNVKKTYSDYSFLAEDGLPALVADVVNKKLVYITPQASQIFTGRNNHLSLEKWLLPFLHKLARNRHLSEKGIATVKENIHQQEYIISASTPDVQKKEIILLQFHYKRSTLPGNSNPDKWMQLIENLPEGVVIHQEGKITYINSAAEELFEQKSDKLMGKSFLSLFKGEVKQNIEQRMTEWTAEKASDFYEFTITTPSGKDRYLGEQTVHISLDGKPGKQTIFTNLSLRKQWIHEKMRAQLAEEINQILKHEIKEHKITQYELEQAKNFNLALIESSMDMIIAEDETGNISVFNKAAEAQFGFHREEVIGKPTHILFKTRQEYQRLKDALQKKKRVSLEIENRRKNGECFTTFLSASVLLTTDGIYLGSMGVSRDISEEKKSAENLKRSEELYRDLFDNMSDAYLLIDAKGNLRYWNKAGLELLGVKPGKAGEINLLKCIDKSHQKQVKEDRKRMLEDGKALKGQEYVLVNGKNQRRYVQVNSSPIFEGKKFTGSRELLRDISDQRKAMHEAESQAAKIKAIFESTAYMIWSVDNEDRLTSFNSNYARIFKKLSRKPAKIGLKALGLSSKTTAKNKTDWKEHYESVFSGKPQNFEINFPDENGKLQWFEVVLNPIDREDGKIEEMSGIAHSITFKKQAEGKIKDQAAKINSIFDSTAMLIWTLDVNFRITSYNANFAKMLQKSFGIEIQIGKDFIEMMNPFIRTDLQEEFKNLYGRAMEGKYVQFEGPARKKNDQIIWMETFLNPIFKEDGTVTEISCMAHEITDKKIIEKQIRESLREKEILLQEVHHRVKNNLQVISSILNLQSSYVKDPNTLNILRESQNRIKSMSFIHESLYQTSDFSSIDFSDYILSLSKNLVHSYSINTGLVELETAFEKVYLNLDQAIPCGLIVNELVSNALKYAFPDNRKGVLTMKISEVGSKIELIIKDNGVGVPKDFDFDHADTLGLQLVYTLIEQLDGEVAFHSKPNKGTEYLITFDKIN